MHRNLQMLGRLFRNFEFTPANDLGRIFSEFPGIFLLTIWQKSTNFGSIFFKILRSLRPKILFFPSLALEMHRNLPIWGRLFRNFEVTPANDVARFFSKFSMQLIADDLTRFCVFFPSPSLEMHRNLPILGRHYLKFEVTPAKDLGRFFSKFPGNLLMTIWQDLAFFSVSCSWNAQKSTNLGSTFSKFWVHSGQRFGLIFLGISISLRPTLLRLTTETIWLLLLKCTQIDQICIDVFKILRSLRPTIWVDFPGSILFRNFQVPPASDLGPFVRKFSVYCVRSIRLSQLISYLPTKWIFTTFVETRAEFWGAALSRGAALVFMSDERLLGAWLRTWGT